jgi:O-antigen biosynthesis protein
MLDWTGERFVPWAKEAAVAYEHLHRYMWASTLVQGKRVLDLASGEGYGSHLLSRRAAHVCGVDIDDAAVRHAAEKYRKSNLQFVKGPITAVPITEIHQFDVIICFEAIEHIQEHEALLSEVKRLLTPEGLFVVSTPNKDAHGAGEDSNPFHVRELAFDEFNALLSRHFSNVSYLGQRLHPASSLWPIGSPNGHAQSIQEFVVERGESEFAEIRDESRVARYFIGIATNGSVIVEPGSVLLDHSDELTDLVNEKDLDLRETKAAADSAKEWFQEQLNERNEALTQRGAEVQQLNDDIQDLTKGVDGLRGDLAWVQSCNQELERTVTSRDQALAWRAEQVDALEKAKTELLHRLAVQAEQLQAVSVELGSKKQELTEIHLSRGWRLILRLRAVRDKLKGVLGK